MKRLITLILIGLSLSVYSQQIAPEVIASAGDHFENGDISLSWTIGEPVIETFSGEYMLTQGFHQDLYIITSVDEVEVADFNVSIFPNPTPDYINIEIQQSTVENNNISIQLLDAKASILKEFNLENISTSTRVNLQAYERANYFLRVVVNNQVKTYKILRI